MRGVREKTHLGEISPHVIQDIGYDSGLNSVGIALGSDENRSRRRPRRKAWVVAPPRRHEKL
jgi:hypothetical protein